MQNLPFVCCFNFIFLELFLLICPLLSNFLIIFFAHLYLPLFPSFPSLLSFLLFFLFIIVASLPLFLHVHIRKSNIGFLVLLIWFYVVCPANIPQIIIVSLIAAWIRMLEMSAPLLILKWHDKIKSFKILLALCVETWNFEYPVSLWHLIIELIINHMLMQLAVDLCRPSGQSLKGIPFSLSC